MAAMAVGVVAAIAGSSFGAEVVTAEVTGTANDVTVTQGSSTASTINISATGSIACTITSANPSTAAIDTSYLLDSSGALTSGSPSAAKNFFSNGVMVGGSASNCGVTWTGDPTPYSVTATFAAAATTPVGDYPVTLSAAAGTTDETNPSVSGGHLGDATATTVTVHVVAPVVTNHAPTVKTTASDATGNEGQPLTTSGAFQDQDGNTLSISKVSGAGSITDNGDGTWSWSYTPPDDGSGTVVVQASDGSLTAQDSFNWTAANVAPTKPGKPSLTSGSSPNKTGQFTLGWTASTDVPADTVTYSLYHEDANDANYSLVASGLSTASYSFGSSNAESEGTWTYQVVATDGEASNSTSDASDASDAVVVDKSAPLAPTGHTSPAAAYNDGTSDWYKDNVTVSFTDNGDPALVDGSVGSGVASVTTSQTFDSTSVQTDGSFSLTGYATDNVGNVSSGMTVGGKVDWQAPTASFSDCPSGAVTQNSTGTLHWSASDAAPSSGLSSDASGTVALETGTIGSHTLSSPAPADNVGHSGTAASCTYNVIYNWTGFFQPVDNPDTCNTVKAGSAIPVKFSLGGYQGMNILALGSPSVSIGSCAGDPVDAVETTVTAGNSSLSYDATSDQYVYVWKTDKTWAGKSMRLTVMLADGTSHYARFTFTK